MSFSCQEHKHCLESALEQAEKICQENDVRLTNVRKHVLELIWAGHKPTKAYDLLRGLQKEYPSAKPPTIYRALDFLLEQGLIHKLHRLNAYVGCHSPNQSRPCFFLVCTSCHTVIESCDKAYHTLISNVSKTHQFKPKEMTFEIEGICSNCA